MALVRKTGPHGGFHLASDLTFQEIGQILDKNGTWARVIYYRAKERLKKLYEKE